MKNIRSTIAALALGLGVYLAAGSWGWTSIQADELKLLASTELTGQLVKLDAKAVTFQADGQDKTIPLDQILWVDLQPAPKPLNATITRQQLLLVDGTVLIGRELKLQPKVAQLTCLDDQVMLVPLIQVAHIIWDAQDAANTEQWAASAARAAKTDLLRLVSRDGKSVNLFEGVLGSVDEKGENILFQLEGGDPRPIALNRVRSLSFSRPKAQVQPVVARLFDVQHNQYLLARLDWQNQAIIGETASGLQIKAEAKHIHRIDFSLGKLVYLSDLTPLKKEVQPLHADYLPHDFDYGRDKNRLGGPLMLGRKAYAKGLGVNSRTLLEYDVNGYQIFRSVIGIDDSLTSGAQPIGHAVVIIEGDNKELFRTIVTARDAKPVEVELKIAGVKRLRLIVDYGENQDLGDHVDFADARILK